MCNNLKKILVPLIAILPLATTACARPHNPTTLPGNNAAMMSKQPQPSSGYLVTAETGEMMVRQIYEQYGVTSIRPIGQGLFELHLQNDPGLAGMENLAKQSGGRIKAVQPNFIYRPQ